MRSFTTPNGESGFALTEVLVTIVIVSVAFTAILGALITSISASSYHRKQATADSLVRDAAEFLKDNSSTGPNRYQNCATTTDYSTALAALPVPTGFATPTVDSVEYWDALAPRWNGGAYAPFPSTWSRSSCQSNGDAGLQRITITARSLDSQVTETVQVIRRRNP